MSQPLFHHYADFSTLSNALVQRWLTLLASTPATAVCSFALAGGTTPAPIYRQFDAAAAGQRQIQLVATDERWVDDNDSQSNEGLFRQCFAHTSAQLISLKNQQPDPASAVAAINTRLSENLPQPFSAVILGMGTDGHIASLFPDAPQLLINDPSRHCVAALHPQTQQPRMSLSMARLLNTQRLWLVITGAEKRQVLEDATPYSPIGALLTAATCDVEIFWCP